MSAIGGENVTTTVEGRERYPVNVRYQRDYPQRHRSPEPCAGADDGRRMQIPVVQLADVKLRQRPGMIATKTGC